MKRLLLATGIILITCVCVSYLAQAKPLFETNKNDYTPVYETENPLYVLKAQNGKLTVFKSGESSPYITTDTSVSSLPKADKTRLEQGVEINGETALKKALEDYCS